MKDVNLGEPTSFFHHVLFGLHSKRMRNEQRYGRQLQKYARIKNFCRSFSKAVMRTLPLGPMIWKATQRNAWNDIASWQTTTRQFHKVATSCIDDHKLKEEEIGSVGELSNVCSQIFMCLCLARIGRNDVLWSVNKLARAITKWTRAFDKRLARLISYIHHTSEFKQNCHVGNSAKQCRLGLFQDSDFAGDSEDP